MAIAVSRLASSYFVLTEGKESLANPISLGIILVSLRLVSISSPKRSEYSYLLFYQNMAGY